MTTVEKHQCSGRVYSDSYYRGYPCGTNAKYLEPDGQGNEVWWCHHHAPSKVADRKAKRDAEWDANQGADEVRRQQAVDRGRKLATLLGVKTGPQWNAHTQKFTGGVTISPDEADKLIHELEVSQDHDHSQTGAQQP